MYFSSSIATQTFISEGVLVAKCFMPSFVLGSVQVCKLAQAIMFLHWDVKSAFLMAELYLLAERVFNETLTSAPTLLLASPLSPPAIFSLHQTMTFHGLMFLQRFSFFVMLPLSTFFSSFVCVNLNICCHSLHILWAEVLYCAASSSCRLNSQRLNWGWGEQNLERKQDSGHILPTVSDYVLVGPNKTGYIKSNQFNMAQVYYWITEKNVSL